MQEVVPGPVGGSWGGEEEEEEVRDSGGGQKVTPVWVAPLLLPHLLPGRGPAFGIPPQTDTSPPRWEASKPFLCNLLFPC